MKPRPSQPIELVAVYLAESAQSWLDADLRRTRAGLARVAGLTAGQVHDLLDGRRRPTQRSLRALSRAVGASYDELEQAASQWLAKGSPRRPTPRRAPRGAASPARALRAVSSAATAPDRYPNRARALAAAKLLDHDPRDIEAVMAVVLPPGAVDPAPQVWLHWVERARDERTDSHASPELPRRR